ncbi:hypothetical protein DENSPDRAFT_904676 [Dentipellis sp. KUC8613]|nr:hypothetical protein DENSPDRAFT_904676 [Dentipellis sp. KUC8613]
MLYTITPSQLFGAPATAPESFYPQASTHVSSGCRQDLSSMGMALDLPAADVIRSQERYRRALAEVRAAEAEYAANVLRAREEAARRQKEEAVRRERQRLLQAEVERVKRQRQLALQAEMERVRREEQRQLQIQMRREAERARRERIEVLRRQLFLEALSTEDQQAEESLSPFAFSRGRKTPVAAPAPSQRTDRKEQANSLKDIFEFIYGAQQGNNTVAVERPSEPAPVIVPKADVKGKGKAKETFPERDGASTPLKSRLENRLHSGEDTEVEEIVRNLLSHLFGFENPAPASPTKDHTQASSSKTTSTSANASSSESASAHAAAEAEGADLARRPAVAAASTERPASPTTSIATIKDIQNSLQTLEAGFVFPPTLDFSESAAEVKDSSDEDSTSSLPYTPTNAPVRAYEHALNALLERLDAVDSEGDEEVRGRRREVVKEVERALGEVDRRVGELKKERAASRSPVRETVSVEVHEPVSAEQAVEEPAAVEQPADKEEVPEAELAADHDDPAVEASTTTESHDVTTSAITESDVGAPAPAPTQEPTGEATATDSIPAVDVLVPSDAAESPEPEAAVVEPEVSQVVDEEGSAHPSAAVEDPSTASTDLAAPLEEVTTPTPTEDKDAPVVEPHTSSSIEEPPSNTTDPVQEQEDVAASPVEVAEVAEPAPVEEEVTGADVATEAKVEAEGISTDAAPTDASPGSKLHAADSSPSLGSVASDGAEEYLSSLSHDQFTFPPAPSKAQREEPDDAADSEGEDAVLVYHGSDGEKPESERDDWSEVEA